MASSSSFGSSSSSSTSTPTYLETPENALINQLSAVAAGLAQQMNSWAQSVYSQTSQITDQAVGNFFDVSQRMSGLATNMTNQYNNLFAPENAQLIADANSYASPERMKVNMGMAGATQAQAGDAAIKNSEQNLLSYGIDPSAGRYAALDKAAAVQNAANIAGAENLQRNQDIATGQRLRSEAVQVGSQLPAAIANANNTAIQANTGASNAALANANTGANLNRLANDYLGTAMRIQQPISGQNTKSQGNSFNSGQSSSPDSGGGARGGGPGGGGGGSPYLGGGGGPAWMPTHTGYQPSGGGARGGGGYQPSAGIRSLNPYGGGSPDWSDPTGNNYDMWSGSGAPNFDYLNDPYGGFDTGYGSIGQQQFDSFDYGGSNPFSDSGFGQTYDYGGPTQSYGGYDYSAMNDWGLGNIGYDTAANNYDPGWQYTYDQPAAWQDTSWGDASGGYSGYDDYSGGGGDFGYSDWGFAQGGQVPPSASPSAGARTDDVRANLNAGEFVIPKDVAAWKGAEFFHNLIAKSRKTRAMSPVGGRPMSPADPRTQGAPTFNSSGAAPSRAANMR